jgi:putative ABC transport system ATP-binding protein
MKEPIVKVENLRVIYNQGKSNEARSLEAINLKIFPNEYVIIYGPSGCGKSTLLYAIAGLQLPTYGEVTVEGRDISKMTKKEKVDLHRNRIGMIFQAFYLIPSVNVLDNVCLPQVFAGREKEERLKEAVRLLRRFGIAEQFNKFPSQLSGGQQQRVAIARSLVNNSQIILADEPVGNLDSESAENVLKILKELNEIDKKTIIMVTHNHTHLRFADRIIYMEDGRITSEEINKDKRPLDLVKEEIMEQPLDISPELKILMRTFKNLSIQQIGVLLTPFKSKQLMTHTLSELTDEQFNAAENIVKEFLFNNIDLATLEKNLDLELDKGGAGWNKQRSRSFVIRIKGITDQLAIINSGKIDEAAKSLADHLVNNFHIKMNAGIKIRLVNFLKLRLENRLDCFELQKRLDAPVLLGGAGLYKNTAEKLTKEVEMIMLLKYAG